MALLSNTDMNDDNSNLAASEFSQLKAQQFMLVNDGVMGGRSKSELSIHDDVARFTGLLSLENNGGFASVRMQWPFDLDASKSEPSMAVLKVKGDGKIYQFRLRTNQGFDGAAYSYSFKSLQNQLQTVYIPINDFVPTFRGRTLHDMPVLKFSAVQQMGLLLADEQLGEFKIDLISLKLE